MQLVLGVPAFMLLAALYGMSKQRLVIVVNLCCLLAFILFAYVLIFGGLSILAQGVVGLAYAFSIQSYLNIIILLFCFRYQNQFEALEIFKLRRPRRWNYLKQLFQIGWPISLQFGGELLGFFVIAMMIAWLGANALAVSQVTQQCLFLFIVPMFAVAEATGIVVS